MGEENGILPVLSSTNSRDSRRGYSDACQKSSSPAQARNRLGNRSGTSREDHEVVAAMRNPSGSPELAELAAKENLAITIETMEVNSDASVAQAFARILAAGPVDVLVNNAGIDRTGAVEELPLAEFRACMETNYFGVIRCIQSVTGPMRKCGSGAIINAASVAGKVSIARMAAYIATKFALEALREALRRSCGHSIFGWPSSSPALSIPRWRTTSARWSTPPSTHKLAASGLCSTRHWSPEQAFLSIILQAKFGFAHREK